MLQRRGCEEGAIQHPLSVKWFLRPLHRHSRLLALKSDSAEDYNCAAKTSAAHTTTKFRVGEGGLWSTLRLMKATANRTADEDLSPTTED